ncbi:hypothetical protein RJ641_026548 [Dillenia turbinata]|uniref:Uncharacterized protein n=1 Tax=Dillenia turbinata TaxID=194707 RepID=A0AAN8WCJ6_9MAGN
MIQIKYIFTLQPDFLSSELAIENLQMSLSLWLIGSVMSHLRVSSPDATYALGLEGSDFFTWPPLLAEFVIIPPDFEERRSSCSRISSASLLSGWGSKNGIEASETVSSKKRSGKMVGEETNNCKQLSYRLSRIYTSAHRRFDEPYIYSPGAEHEYYGKYSYLCIGQSAMLEPIVVVGPQEMWKGGQQLHNANL